MESHDFKDLISTATEFNLHIFQDAICAKVPVPSCLAFHPEDLGLVFESCAACTIDRIVDRPTRLWTSALLVIRLERGEGASEGRPILSDVS